MVGTWREGSIGWRVGQEGRRLAVVFLGTLRLSAEAYPEPTCVWRPRSTPRLGTPRSRSGAVELSPGCGLFFNAGGFGASRATSERPRDVSVDVALIVPLPVVGVGFSTDSMM